MSRNCKFQSVWLVDADFKEWTAEGSNPYEACCRICNTTFQLARMGDGSVKSQQGTEVTRSQGSNNERLLYYRKDRNASPSHTGKAA